MALDETLNEEIEEKRIAYLRTPYTDHAVDYWDNAEIRAMVQDFGQRGLEQGWPWAAGAAYIWRSILEYALSVPGARLDERYGLTLEVREFRTKTDPQRPVRPYCTVDVAHQWEQIGANGERLAAVCVFCLDVTQGSLEITQEEADALVHRHMPSEEARRKKHAIILVKRNNLAVFQWRENEREELALCRLRRLEKQGSLCLWRDHEVVEAFLKRLRRRMHRVRRVEGQSYCVFKDAWSEDDSDGEDEEDGDEEDTEDLAMDYFPYSPMHTDDDSGDYCHVIEMPEGYR
ncbi:uncharacterized protein BO97DRAFT_417878 [Aspergillus homomorphus CBS 101889]|uniref:Uncharacterized protein n=1 Tax=Aspergillus homomorphus (strain CBS 101889) TaxID=1450537 RepID=A0A395HKK1_ASPHC|nr:hypothetical protein BO97DRAFT_417878 [Aspergillus homomorphus CBS 101889]RAL08270.1 hypothetical protein BO97DRAFT_417878 [Aspergillus homomorphus CBS 101889]